MAEIKSRVDNLLAANVEFAKSFTTPPTMPQLRANKGERIFVVSCMDPRVVPEQFLGPNAFPAVFRNAGGRYTPDVVESITALRSLAYQTESITVMVVHHTDCGATHLDVDTIRRDIAARGSGDPDFAKEIGVRLFAAKDLDKTVLDDVAALKAHEQLQGVHIRGFVLDLETGLLKEVEA